MGVVFLSLYFSSLIGFSFVSHPVVYCILLLTGALGISGYLYTVLGLSWYLVLFCLVYVGGIYVLFIFVSVHLSNPMSVSGSSGSVLLSVFLLFLLFFSGVPSSGMDGFCESSHYLCSYFEGFSYCLFCLILMVGFVGISAVSGEKDSFFR
uniref:NADH dehydrogenase subunit 6 n=1 Tax=Paragonimus westermani TaxID=34504 RepID=Q8HN28_9TREM|nr:NADH dehydrogenase subunit 6 [Paragonimus westermani]QWT69523.1 NADH dehydrogenase subunit 6 [Paragonimus westermani]QWT69535.1 NADH dehydrogenase subunit 6 [Paragonimus westermani]